MIAFPTDRPSRIQYQEISRKWSWINRRVFAARRKKPLLVAANICLSPDKHPWYFCLWMPIVLRKLAFFLWKSSDWSPCSDAAKQQILDYSLNTSSPWKIPLVSPWHATIVSIYLNYPLVICYIAIENSHRKFIDEFPLKAWWIFPVRYGTVYQRVFHGIILTIIITIIITII